MGTSNMSYIGENDALPLEHKLLNWEPLRQVDVSYFVGDSAIKCFLGAQEGHVQEQFVNVVASEAGVTHHNI